ncbi:MAG: protein jag, partial [Fusobacteriaceae bacterium]
QNLIEIKSMSKEAAVQRALKILDATPEQVVSVEEKVKSRSFLGLFNKEGVYVVTVDKTLREKKIVPESIVAEKTEIKTEIKKEIETVAINTKKEIQEEKKIEIPKKEISKKQAKIDKEAIILEKTRELLKHMDLNLDAEIAAREGKFYVVNLFGDDNGIIIGKKGKTLNSFEYLLNCILKDCKIELDVEGFKEKRKETLRELGRKMAKKALSTGKTIRLNPMPPRERKIIHEVINRFEGLDTFSEGADPKRYIVIKKKKSENVKVSSKVKTEVKTEE